MKSDIREVCRSCGKCAQFQVQNAKEPMKYQPVPEYPWQLVSQDLCAFESSSYLVTTDHYSDFIEVNELENTLSATIAAKTEAHFAHHGVPETILTDNGPQFVASDFERLCQRYQTNHITSSPYWPKGNGKSGASVKIVKRILKKSGKNGLHESSPCLHKHPPRGASFEPSTKEYGTPHPWPPSYI